MFDGDEYIADIILRTETNRANQYYTNLYEECAQRESESCCLSSVNAMEVGGHKLMSNTGCGEDFTQNMLKCVDTFTWCEPVTEDGLIEDVRN